MAGLWKLRLRSGEGAPAAYGTKSSAFWRQMLAQDCPAAEFDIPDTHASQARPTGNPPIAIDPH